MKIAARKLRIDLPAETAIDAEVDLGMLRDGYVSLPGLDRQQAHAIVEEAHRTCPYSKATREHRRTDPTVLSKPVSKCGGDRA